MVAIVFGEEAERAPAAASVPASRAMVSLAVRVLETMAFIVGSLQPNRNTFAFPLLL